MKYARQLKRMDAVRRSPIYSHLTESITGASSIRAYKRTDSFIKIADDLIDQSQRPYMMLIAAMR